MSTVHSAYNKVAYNNFLISETYFFLAKLALCVSKKTNWIKQAQVYQNATYVKLFYVCVTN